LAASAGVEASVGGQGGQAAPSATGAAGDEALAKLDPRLHGDLAAGQSHDVIVLLDQGPTAATDASDSQQDPVAVSAAHLRLAKDGLLGRLRMQPLSTVDSFQHLPAIHMQAQSSAALLALASDPAVVRIVPNEALAMLEAVPADLSLIKQPAAAAAGKLGAGTAVAVLDTGADFKRAPFNCAAAGATGCPIVYAADMAPSDNNVDDNGHGTNVSGIVLSVAPAAKIIALDVFTGSSAWTADIMKAIDWCIQNKTTYNIVSINLSLGGGVSTTSCALDPLAVSIASAKKAGILSAVASGNAGTSNAIATPACGPDAISVGAVHAADLGTVQWSSCRDATTKADQIACFSCSSSFLTMLAPGVMITAAGITMSGTSQATPHVAGAIAVLRSAFPAETPTAIVARLTSSGVPVTDPRNGITKPRLDLWAALNAAAAVPTPTPAPAVGPVGTLVLNGNAAFTKTSVVSAALVTTSGTAKQVCLSEATACTSWVTAAATLSFSLSNGDGSKTVRAWWKDAAGNVSAKAATATIVLDTTGPTGGALSAVAVGLQASFTWSGFADAGSGVAGYRLVTSATAVAAGCLSGSVAYEGNATTFSKAFAAGTLYARLCAKDGLGTFGAGLAASVVLKAPAHAAVLSGVDATGLAGNATGGTSYQDACPAGQALVGFVGSLSQATTAAVHRQIGGVCGTLQVTGTAVSVNQGSSLPARGKVGVSAWSRTCPANQVVVGFAGRSGLLVDQLTFTCAPLAASAATVGAPLTVGVATSLAAVGGTGGTAFAAIKCPAGEMARASSVRTGDNLAAFSLLCSKATVGP
jgi:subtilisin family serine protease